MDKLIAMLRDEERKLTGRLTGLRAAIAALSGNSSKPYDARRGRKLSLKHRLAIKAGIAKAKKAAGKA